LKKLCNRVKTLERYRSTYALHRFINLEIISEINRLDHIFVSHHSKSKIHVLVITLLLCKSYKKNSTRPDIPPQNKKSHSRSSDSKSCSNTDFWKDAPVHNNKFIQAEAAWTISDLSNINSTLNKYSHLFSRDWWTAKFKI
jgi:hypothetical protein